MKKKNKLLLVESEMKTPQGHFLNNLIDTTLCFEKKVDVLASLKPKLLEDMANHSGLRMIDPPFTAVKQSICLAKGKADSIAFLNALIAQSIENLFHKFRL